MPAASSPCLAALNRVDVVLFGPVDFFALRRFAEILLVMIPPCCRPAQLPCRIFSARKGSTQPYRLSSDSTACPQPLLRPLPVAYVRAFVSGINLFLAA